MVATGTGTGTGTSAAKNGGTDGTCKTTSTMTTSIMANGNYNGNVGASLWVGNLVADATATRIKRAFASYGTVVDAVVCRARGRALGYGFVEMAGWSEAEAAVKALSQSTAHANLTGTRPLKLKFRSTGDGNGDADREDGDVGTLEPDHVPNHHHHGGHDSPPANFRRESTLVEVGGGPDTSMTMTDANSSTHTFYTNGQTNGAGVPAPVGNSTGAAGIGLPGINLNPANPWGQGVKALGFGKSDE